MVTSQHRVFSALGVRGVFLLGAASLELLESQALLSSMVPSSFPRDLPFSHSFCEVPQGHLSKAAPISIAAHPLAVP